MNRSFRVLLGLRGAAVMAVAMLAISLVSVVTLSSLLDREIDATILNVASIQAASVTDEPSGAMHFHEWEITPDEAASVRDLVRYAQVWQADGVSLLRSQYMTADLPLNRQHLVTSSEGELVWTEDVYEGVPVRLLYYPLERLGALHERHVLQVAAPLGGRNALVSRVSGFLALVTAIVAGATFAGSWWLAGRAMRPVYEVIDQAEVIGAGSLDRRIRSYADMREYRRLVEVLNTMLARIQGAFEAQRRFTADASHELRSPLTAMRGELEIALRRERDPDEYRRVLASTLEEVVRLSRVAEDLLALARSDSGALLGHAEPVEIDGVARSVVERLRTTAVGKGVKVVSQSSGGSTIEGDPTLLGQVVWNLLDNAIRFAPPGSVVTVETVGEESHIVLSVSDEGPGFPEEQIEKVFDRFFRADGVRPHSGGAGLGLGIVRAVVEGLGGTVRAENLSAGGARVVARFRRTGDEAISAPS